ncbi:hypothetical protein FRB90_011393 [Tulasnella sp. 427]|nr:hypothetical protein FRB90_011393 [Tulasnella sp. 427]
MGWIRFSAIRAAVFTLCFLASAAVLGLAAYQATVFMVNKFDKPWIITALVISVISVLASAGLAFRYSFMTHIACIALLTVMWLSLASYTTDRIGYVQCENLTGKRPTVHGRGNGSNVAWCRELKAAMGLSWFNFGLCLIAIVAWLRLQESEEHQGFREGDSESDREEFRAAETAEAAFTELPGGRRRRLYANGVPVVAGQPALMTGATAYPAAATLPNGTGGQVVYQQPGHNIVIQNGQIRQTAAGNLCSASSLKPVYEQMSSHHLQPPDDRQVRAFAVAKLKRAASLPRMRDGRRLPMHGEAFSEGERATPSPDPTTVTVDDENNLTGEETVQNAKNPYQDHAGQPPPQTAQESSNLNTSSDSTPATPATPIAHADHDNAAEIEHHPTPPARHPAASSKPLLGRSPPQPSPHPGPSSLHLESNDASANPDMEAEDDYDQEQNPQDSSLRSSAVGVHQTESEDAEPESNPSRTTTPTTAGGSSRRRKRRSRSRSRTRSKDLSREALGQSSGDESTTAATSLPPPPVPISPFLASVNPSPRLPPTLNPQTPPPPRATAGRPFLPTPISPFLGASTSPTSASPLPSLDAIRAGLIRSNSATGRMMAFHKLTGGTESPEPMSLPPSAPGLSRSNTVTGGERLAVRNMMFRTLGGRIKEGEPPTTIAEEPTQATPTRRRPIPPDLISPSLRPQYNRSPQMSAGNNGIVDDREVSETSPNSPVNRSIPLHISERPGHTPIPETPGDQYASTRTGPSTSTSSAFGYTQTTDSSHPEPFEYDGAEVRDGVVIEPDEPDSSRPHQHQHQHQHQQQMSYVSQSSSYSVTSPILGPLPRPLRRNAPSESSAVSSPTDNIRENIPLFLPAHGEQSPYRQDTFPVAISPFNKGSIIAESEEEGETVVYHEEMKARKAWPDRAPVSWISPSTEFASGSTPWNQPTESTYQEEDVLPEGKDVDSHEVSDSQDTEAWKTSFADNYASPQDNLGTPPETPLSTLSTSPPNNQPHRSDTPSARLSNASESAASVTSSSQLAGSQAQNKTPDPADQLEEWQELPPESRGPATKEKKKSESRWEKVKALTRSGSSLSIRRPRSSSSANGKQPESSRESAASQNSVTNLATPLNATASSSALSLAPPLAVPPPRGGVSPVPPASAADLARYADQKLNPFPGLAKLQEEKKQMEGKPAGTKSGPAGKTPSPPAEAVARSLSRNGSFKAPTPGERSVTPGGSVPKDGVRKWFAAKGWLGSSQPEPAQPSAPVVEIVPPGTAMKPPERKASLTELHSANLTSDSATEKEDSSKTHVLPRGKSHDAMTTPTMEAMAEPLGPQDTLTSETMSETPPVATPLSNDFPSIPLLSTQTLQPSPHPSAHSFTSAVTRENAARMDERRTNLIMQKLDSILEHAAKDPTRSNVLDQPPRKLLLMSKAFQVLDKNTIKDRYLFLFSDILVIAKPVDEDHGRDNGKAALDQMFAAKSIVELAKVEFDASRDGDGTTLGADFNRHPSIRSFIQRFAQNPDHALRAFLDKTKLKDDPLTIANLLFRTIDLDRAQLGEYLSRKSNKAILKTFIDRFGFAGVRIDNALRAFLLSIRIPNDAALLEHMLITFAGRWFEANTGVVAYDKETAARLVFAMMQLNDALHSDLDSDMTPAGGVFSFPNRDISSRDFIDAVRSWDRGMEVPDEILEKIYRSIKSEKLAQASDRTTPLKEAMISPANLPPRLTTRIPSEVITIRIPAPDPDFGIHLQGQDLLFEPPFLSFAHSNEVSFRVIGNALGNKTAIFARTGANANLYTGIPLSKTFAVERPFMRYTFKVAFTNHAGLARKYLFSVESRTEHVNWTSTLEKQIAKCRTEMPAAVGPVSPKVRRAAEAVALRVLRDALIVPDESTKGDGGRGGPPSRTGTGFPALGRGPGGGQHASREEVGPGNGGGFGGRGTAKSGHDILLIVQQNSLIPLVLSFLNVVKPI